MLSSTTYGVAEVNLSNGARSAFISITPAADGFTNKATCVFDIDGNRMYVAYIDSDGDLQVEYRTFASSTLNRWMDFGTDLTGRIRYQYPGWDFDGPMEIFAHNSNVYLVAQYKLNQNSYESIFPDGDYNDYKFQDNSIAVLYQIQQDSPTLLKQYDYCQTAARSFAVHDNMVHFFEGSPIQYKYEPHNFAGFTK